MMIAVAAANFGNACLLTTGLLLSMGPALSRSLSSVARAYTNGGEQGTSIVDDPGEGRGVPAASRRRRALCRRDPSGHVVRDAAAAPFARTIA